MKETLKITGMTCAACSARVERSIGKMDGVESCSVNLTTERLMVEFDSAKIDLDSVKKTIEKVGYGRAEIKKDTVDEDKLRKEKEIKTLWFKFILSATFTICILP